MKKLVYESLSDVLKPKSVSDVLKSIINLSAEEAIEKLKLMRSRWGNAYKEFINNEELKQNIRDKIKKDLDKLEIINKVNYIEIIERELPDIFSGMKDDKLIKELKDYVINQNFENKFKLVWRFFKYWPDLFKDLEDDPRIDPETNQLMLLFKIKGAINNGQVDKLQEFIHEMGEKYGRKNILDKASKIIISSDRSYDYNLFNKKDIEQLKFSLYKETRSEEELARDEYADVYAFIGYPDFKETIINNETYHKKQLGIENLVKINKYDASSLSQVSMMKIRAAHQDQTEGRVWGVYIPKNMWNKDHAYNNDIPDNLRKFIDENKFSF
jgi:hypothetical protein